MAANARIYYPIHAVGFGPVGAAGSTSGAFRAAKGVQSVGMNTNFALEQVYQLGQLSLYENIENLPETELTVEKVVDGYSLLEHLATPGATAATLAGRFNSNQCNMVIAYYPIANDAASGVPLSYVQLSGVYVSAINWNLPVEGNITESVTLTCRDKQWFTSPTNASVFASGTAGTGVAGRLPGYFTGSESPLTASGGVQRRENVVMGSGFSVWPLNIAGIDVNGFNASGAGGFAAHIQSVTIGINLGRTDLLELGRRGPYFRYANFPTEVTTSIEVTESELGDNVNAFQDIENLTDYQITILLTNGVRINLGNKNKLASITSQGGDTGGGNRTVTYNYSNFNDYRCTMPTTDPAGLS